MRNNEINLEGLDEIFGETDNADREFEQKTIDFETNIDYDKPLVALKNNIYNANQLLDKIQHEMNNGNFSARLAEVAGSIINSVTQSSKELLADSNYEKYMEVRRALVILKEKEIEIREKKMVRAPNQTTNVLVTSREDLLKVLEDRKPKQIE
jgi:transposase-like protein